MIFLFQWKAVGTLGWDSSSREGRHTEQDHGKGDEVELQKVGLLVPGLVVARQRGQFLNGIHHGGSWCCDGEAVREAELKYGLTMKR